MAALGKNDHIYLVDGSSYIFRAYHALPPLTRKSDGLPVGAVSGFCNMLMKLRDDMEVDSSPTHLAVIFDPPGGSFRNGIYEAYKANRGAPPEDLVPQFPLVRVATEAFGIPALEVSGFEADDLIASYTKAARAEGAQVTIVSSDKDLMQLIEDGVDMLDTMKNRRMGHDAVIEKFGVGPDRVIDVQSLAGDSVDNVPGVPGIGIKTAAQLISEYGDLDSLLARAAEIKQPKRRESLIEFAEQARISRELVTLKCDTPLPADWAAMRLGDPEPETLIGFLKAMEFTTLTKRVASRYAFEADQIEATDSLQAAARPAAKAAPKAGASSNELPRAGTRAATYDPRQDWPPIAPATYVTITQAEELAMWIARAEEQGYFAIDTETDGLDAMQCNLVGISLAIAPGEAAYIPLAHGSGSLDLDGGGAQMPLQTALDLLAPLCARDDIVKILQNAKFDMLLLSRYGVRFCAIDDTMLMSYAMAAGQHGHGMDELARLWLEHEAISIKTLLGTGKAQKTFDQVPIEDATRYAAEDADITLRLWMTLKPLLAAQGVMTVYETSERPLVPVIVEMEANGVMVDRQHLSHLSGELAQKMAAMESEIFDLADTEFNIASPKQLGEILFEKLSLPGGKKTKTGAYATGADILEGLAAEGHALPAAVLRWRGMAKLKSTYTDALPTFINPTTGRIHTSYSLAATTTGRLSSSDPNLQNIPIRSEEGRRIREAFIAPEQHVLVSADYSQIELRILAHMADIGALKSAFAEGQDIHAMTASEIFNVPMKEMTPEIRRRAKAINFGIIYGISAFGLANQLGISRGEAGDYIAAYFERFPGIKDYMETTKKAAHAQGYVTTLFGRKVHFKDIDAKQPALRAFAERAAINAPIQGTAADIIRRAMIRMPAALESLTFPAKMLLQVHDELIFEVHEDKAEDLITSVRRVMEGACEPRIKLAVPLVVDARAAKNWDEAH
jgi:DNA polymerase-1